MRWPQARWLILGLIIVCLIVAGAWMLRGRGLRMAMTHRVRSLLAHDRMDEAGTVSVLFLHHSVGRYLIQKGGMRAALRDSGIAFWDHDYNYIGLTRPDGESAGYSYLISEDNTDPDGLERLFTQKVRELPWNAISGLMQHDVLVFKSCFPASRIASEDQLEAYKGHYALIRDFADQHPEKLFIALTTPPLNPAATDSEAAARARAFASWLASEDYLDGHPNVQTFDLFDALAEDDPSQQDFNMLRREYRVGDDSHPNLLANQRVGPQLAEFIAEAVHSFEGFQP